MRKIFLEKKRKVTIYQRFLNLLCWLKLIPVTMEKNTGAVRFHPFSLPTLLSTSWFCLIFSYFIYTLQVLQKEDAPKEILNSTAKDSKNITEPKENPYSSSNLDSYISIAFIIALMMAVLLLPAIMGYFFSLNGSAMLKTRFAWPRRGWMLVMSLISFLVTSTVSLTIMLIVNKTLGMSTFGLVHWYTSNQVINLSAAIIQFIALMLVSIRQTSFINSVRVYAADSSKIKSPDVISNLLQNYEYIRKGIGPFNVFEFCIHAPIILCYSYFGLNNSATRAMIGNIFWSCLILTHICFMSDDCFDALQSLLPSIRYFILNVLFYHLFYSM